MLVLAIPIPVCLSVRDMRLSRVSQGLLYGFAIATLLACIFATSSHVNLVPYRGPSPFKRSLPASLVTAPEGAIGHHQPPSGPATDRTQPIETLGASPKPTTTPTAREMAHEPRDARAEQNQGMVTNRYVCSLSNATRELMNWPISGSDLIMSLW